MHLNAYPPKRSSSYAAGYDLCSLLDSTVPARGKQIISTGLKVILPAGCYGRIAPRSGLAAKNFIDVGAGVIDADYQGEILVVLFNHSNKDFEINSGDRIAQLICEKIAYPDLEEIVEFPAVGEKSVRGVGGFGSTGR